MKEFLERTMVALAVVVSCVTTGSEARADLVLNSAGIADGFRLTVFATMNPGNTATGTAGCCRGPFGLAVTQSGQATVFVNDVANGTIYTFNDTDGQTPATASHTLTGNTDAEGATAVGSTFWGGSPSDNSTFTTYNNSLSNIVTKTITDSTGNQYYVERGMATTPDGHIIATASKVANTLIPDSLIEITPGNSVARLIAQPPGLEDGVSLSPDGTQIYVEYSGAVQVYRRSDGTLLHTYPVSNTPDGTGVIAAGPLAGQILVTGNDGTIDLIDTAGNVTTIATGGSRLDYTAPDVNNGSLLIDSADLIYRLSCSNPNCSIVEQVPEPGPIFLFGGGALMVAMVRRRVRR